MFKLNEMYEFNRRILKSDFIRYSPSEVSTINGANSPNSPIYINIPRKASVNSLLNSYIDLNFDVVHDATDNRYADNKDLRSVNLGPTALFGNYKLTRSSGKHLEDISHGRVVPSLYKVITIVRDTDDLPIGLNHDQVARQRECTNNKFKFQKSKFHLRIMLQLFFGFAEHQKKATYSLGYKQTLTSNSDNGVLNKDNATNIGKIKTNNIEWYVSQ